MVFSTYSGLFPPPMKYDISEILLKVPLNTITLALSQKCYYIKMSSEQYLTTYYSFLWPDERSSWYTFSNRRFSSSMDSSRVRIKSFGRESWCSERWGGRGLIRRYDSYLPYIFVVYLFIFCFYRKENHDALKDGGGMIVISLICLSSALYLVFIMKFYIKFFRCWQ